MPARAQLNMRDLLLRTVWIVPFPAQYRRLFDLSMPNRRFTELAARRNQVLVPYEPTGSRETHQAHSCPERPKRSPEEPGPSATLFSSDCVVSKCPRHCKTFISQRCAVSRKQAQIETFYPLVPRKYPLHHCEHFPILLTQSTQVLILVREGSESIR